MVTSRNARQAAACRHAGPRCASLAMGYAVDARYARIAKLREVFLQSGVNTEVFLDGVARRRKASS